MPFVKFPAVNKKYGNSGSCRMDVEYLSKENGEKQHTESEMFFNDKEAFIGNEAAVKAIDGNSRKGLTKDDAKYYEVIIAFSQEELKGKSNREIKDFIKESFPKIYAESVKGKKEADPDKLVWVAKLEEERKYRGYDKEVKEGKGKSGELKEGDNRHVHIIIARKNNDGSQQISPLTNHRKESKGMIKSGFERNHFKQETEKAFDKKFEHERPYDKKFEYVNTMKNGTDKEKEQLLERIKEQQKQQEKVQETTKDKGMSL